MRSFCITLLTAVACAGNDKPGAIDGAVLVAGPLLVAGHGHTCVSLDAPAGNVRCWGSNLYDQLGNGSPVDAPTPVTVRGLTGVVALAAGSVHTCAIVVGDAAGGGAGQGDRQGDGNVHCWGYNGSGQLGTGSYANASTPVAVQGLGRADFISTGDISTCAVVAAVASCWGDNQHGKLGNDQMDDANLPVKAPGGAGASAIAAGGYHSCVLVPGAGGTHVRCWGFNAYGQLGDGTTRNAIAGIDVVDLSGATALVAGDNHSCALAGGQAYCWGAGDEGQLGTGRLQNESRPARIDLPGQVAALAAGVTSTCALLNDGGVYCWGNNLYGQLGNGSRENSARPVAVTGLARAVAIAVSLDHACAVLEGGLVRCWGHNEFGQLGDGTLRDSTTPVPVAGL